MENGNGSGGRLSSERGGIAAPKRGSSAASGIGAPVGLFAVSGIGRACATGPACRTVASRDQRDLPGHADYATSVPGIWRDGGCQQTTTDLSLVA
jgi:hypothetical protein